MDREGSIGGAGARDERGTVGPMNTIRKGMVAHVGRSTVLGAALVVAIAGCGGATTSGVTVGRVGQGLSTHAHAVPQGAEVCAIKEALAAQPGAEKPASETCSKAAKSDELWRRSMIVLAAHGDTLGAIASGNDAKTTGQLAAATTGVKGSNWIEVDEGSEKAAREAAAKLVEQMAGEANKDDLGKAVTEAAPHVKTLCDGLGKYLDAQAAGFDDALKEVEKKRAAHSDRRCTMLDNRSVCVSDSGTDRVVYAHASSQLAGLASSHADARDALAAFCTAHQKLEEAAGKGTLSDDATNAAVIEAVRSSHRDRAATAAPSAPPAKK